MSNDLFGSAEWNVWEGVEEKEALSGDGFVIGYPLPNSFDPKDALKKRLHIFHPQRHFLSVAPTRSGKGVSLIIPNLLQYKGSCIVIDPKGENAWITAKFRREKLLQKTIILDPWGEVNRRYGDLAGEKELTYRFNPLSILDPSSDHYADDLAYLADALIINQGKDPHWDDSARELVAGLMAYAVESFGDDASLSMVRLLLSKPSEEIAGIAKDAQNLGFESVAARKLGRFINDSKEVSSIVSTALTQTAFLDSVTLGESLATADFSFEDLVNDKTGSTIYLVLPVDKLQTYGRWLRLMVSIGIRTVARNTKPLKFPVLFLLDEFGTIGRLSAVAQAYGLMAGLQMCIWAFVQDLGQLKRDYPDDWETFIGNSKVVTFFNVMDQSTAEYFSKMLGKETVEEISVRTKNMREGSFFKKGDPDYRAMTDKTFSRDLMMPEEIRIVFSELGVAIGRFPPVRFKKIVYYHDNNFASRARKNPVYYRPRTKKEMESLAEGEPMAQDFVTALKELKKK